MKPESKRRDVQAQFPRPALVLRPLYIRSILDTRVTTATAAVAVGGRSIAGGTHSAVLLMPPLADSVTQLII